MKSEILHMETILELQGRLVATRKILPAAIEKIYEKARIAHIKLLLQYDFKLCELPDISVEVIQNIQRDTQGGPNVLEEYIEQIRLMIILADKKNCEISNIIDKI